MWLGFTSSTSLTLFSFLISLISNCLFVRTWILPDIAPLLDPPRPLGDGVVDDEVVGDVVGHSGPVCFFFLGPVGLKPLEFRKL